MSKKKSPGGQIYAIPTLDTAFKYVLDLESIRPSFFHAFLPGIVVTSSTRLDDRMNSLQEFQVLRHFLHQEEVKKKVELLQKQTVEVYVGGEKKVLFDEKATDLFEDFLRHFSEISSAFPLPDYDGSLDFVCQLDTGEYALIEMQVLPQNCWDRRALAYVAYCYGKQLKRGSSWDQIKRVIGLNILGGGLKDLDHWKETPQQYIRYYKLQEQLSKDHPRFMDGIEIIQYSLKNAPLDDDSQERRDWILFFKNAQNMSEEEVKKEIRTPEVLQAFERAKICAMPTPIQQRYRTDEEKYGMVSDYIATIREEEAKERKARLQERKARLQERKARLESDKARLESDKARLAAEEALAKTKISIKEKNCEIARALLKEKIPLAKVQKITGLSLQEINEL